MNLKAGWTWNWDAVYVIRDGRMKEAERRPNYPSARVDSLHRSCSAKNAAQCPTTIQFIFAGIGDTTSSQRKSASGAGLSRSHIDG